MLYEPLHRIVSEYHGTSGEVPVDYANTTTKLTKLLLEACSQSGYPVLDYNGPVQLGT